MKGEPRGYITADELESKLEELVVYDIRELFELQVRTSESYLNCSR